jgi:hypothetical protein
VRILALQNGIVERHIQRRLLTPDGNHNCGSPLRNDTTRERLIWHHAELGEKKSAQADATRAHLRP